MSNYINETRFIVKDAEDRGPYEDFNSAVQRHGDELKRATDAIADYLYEHWRQEDETDNARNEN